MSKRDELIAKYAEDMKAKCNVTADMDLLSKVVIGLGPSVYNADSSLVSSSDSAEMDRVKQNFLIKKLGLADGPDLDAGLDKVIDLYGRSNANKHRAVVYYLLTRHFKKENVYA